MDSSTDEDDYSGSNQVPSEPHIALPDESDDSDSDYDLDDPRDELSESEDELLEFDDTGDAGLESEVQELQEPSYLIGKDGTKWNFDAPLPARRPAANILVKKPGLTSFSRHVKSFADAFHIFMTNKILSRIIKYTNNKAKAVYEKEERDWKEIDEIEFNAFIGLLFFPVFFKTESNLSHLSGNHVELRLEESTHL